MLRAALQETNARTGRDTINFAIPNSDPNRDATTGVFTIAPASALPDINIPVTINAYSQPGSKANALAMGSDAVRLITLEGRRLSFQATAGGSTVRGLTIDNFGGGSLVIFGGDGYVIAGCNIKGGGNGLSGVHFFSGNNNTIGGLNPADRNVLDNIDLRGNNNTVQNNYIGVNEQGTGRGSSFQTGVVIRGGSNNVIGGPDARAGNVISGNGTSFGSGGTDGISVESAFSSDPPPVDNNLIQNNIIGLNAAGTAPLGNIGSGISITSFRTPITNTRIIGNVISGNGSTNTQDFAGDGVEIAGQGVTSTLITGNIIGLNKARTNFAPNIRNGIAILGSTANESVGNVISANFIAGNGKFGIDLGGSSSIGGDGVTANDANDADTGPNNRQNFPVLTSVSGTATSTTIQGTLNSLPSTSFRIEFFSSGAADPSGNGEGQTFLGFGNVTTGGAGNATINVTLPVARPASQNFITATATRLNGTALVETSEFSAARQATGGSCSLIVTNTNNAGAGSLRGAIECANASNFVQTITFNIPGPATTVKTINLAAPLPTVAVPLTINGFSQPGANPFTRIEQEIDGNSTVTETPARLRIELNGAGAGTTANGLVFGPGSANSVVRGLVINRFRGNGIVLRTDNIRVGGNYIGTNADGSATLGNAGNGVFVDGGSNNFIGDEVEEGQTGSDDVTIFRYFNLISGNTSTNVRIATNAQGAGGTANVLGENYIGTDVVFSQRTTDEGTAVDINFTKALGGGVGVAIAASGNRIGSGENTVIAGNTGPGLDIVRGDNNTIFQTVIGTEVNLDEAGNDTPLGNGGHGIIVGSGGAANNNFIGARVEFNRGDGVRVVNGNGNRIGSNIESNQGDGVHVLTGTGNTISATISSSGGLGINLGTDGVTANDANDPDTGPNLRQNFPVLTSALPGSSLPGSGGGSGQVNGTLNSTPNTTFRLRFFSSSAADPSGHGEGQSEVFIGTDPFFPTPATVTTNAQGNATFSFATGANLQSLDFVTATATDPNGNTSEFSRALQAKIRTFTSLTSSLASQGNEANAGQPVTFTATVKGDLDFEESPPFTGTVTFRDGHHTVLGIANVNTSGVASFTTTALTVGTHGITATYNGDVNYAPSSGGPITITINPAGTCLPIVTNTNNAGAGSLRAAIECSDSRTGRQTIRFNIPGTGVKTITPTTPLPAITDPAIIDGLTQPGSSSDPGDDRLIELNGQSAGAAANGLILGVGSDGSTIRGLAVNRFGGAGIEIRSDNNTIAGNFIGTDTAGMTARPNGVGVRIITARGNRVTSQSGISNVISGNRTHGVHIIGSDGDQGNSVIDNQIGTDVREDADLGNGQYGVFLENTRNNSVSSNTLQGNNSGGVLIRGGSNNQIRSNTIGASAFFGEPLGNGTSGVTTAGDGVLIENSTGNSLSSNSIAANVRDGIRIDGATSTNNVIGLNNIGFFNFEGVLIGNGGNGVTILGGTGNDLNQNRMAGNGKLGIDLANDGVTPNDAGDADIGPNLRQNYPVITSAQATQTNTVVQGTLNSRPNTEYEIQFFSSIAADASGRGEGQTFIGRANVTTNAQGNATINVTLAPNLAIPSVPPPGEPFITATAIDPDGNTSEFSAARRATYQTCSLVVTTTANTGPGSLREAINCANFTPGVQTITFNIPGPATQVKTIALTSILPAIVDPVIINGYSQPGSSAATATTAAQLRIELNGAGVRSSGGIVGLSFRRTQNSASSSSGSVVRGLVINNFSDAGIVLAADNITVAGCYIGTNATGTAALPNDTGIAIGGLFGGSGANSNTIGGTTPADRDVISGNSSSGILISQRANNNRVLGNYIGTNAAGTADLGNDNLGIYIQSSGNTVGGAGGARNIIAGNNGNGISIDGGQSFEFPPTEGENTVQNNIIGLSATGTIAIGNGRVGQFGPFGDGVRISNGFDNRILDNVISANLGAGVSISAVNEFGLATGNLVQGNAIGLNAARTTTIGNGGPGIVLSAFAFNTGDNLQATGNVFSQNAIAGNGGLGIDVVKSGDANNTVTPNDTLDADTGPNNLQNFPVLTSATGSVITGTLNSVPNTGFRIEFFSSAAKDASNFGEGQRFLGFQNVTTNAQGNAPVNFTSPTALSGQFVTATATRLNGANLVETSEFSNAIQASSATRATTTTLTAAPNPSTFGQAVTFTATVRPTTGTGTPTGTVTFSEGTTTLGTGTLNASGVATFNTAALTGGTHNITATYNGDTTFIGSTSAAVAQRVNKANTTTTLTSAPNPSVQGEAVTFTATVSESTPGTPTGTVTFREGNTVLGTGTLDATRKAVLNIASLSVGTHTITATYAGDANFNGSPSAAATQTVNRTGTRTTLTSAPNPSAFGQTVTFTASVTAVGTSGTPTGSVTFKEGTTNLGTRNLNASQQATFTTSALSVGAHSITATYNGNANLSGSTSPALTQTVNKAATTITLISAPNPSVFGQAVTLTAQVAESTPGTPTGTVQFIAEARSLGTATVDATGKATLTTTAFNVGIHDVAANYSGDTNFLASSVLNSGFQSVNKANTRTTLTSSQNPSVRGQAVTFTATVNAVAPGAGTPAGTVTFRDGNTTLGTGSLNANRQATFTTSTLSIGNHAITATYNGNGNFNGSASPALTQTVNNAAATATTLTSSANPSVSGQSVTLTAVVSSGAGTPTGTVAFREGTTVLGTRSLVNGRATLILSNLSVGSHGFTATYSGSTGFNGSTSASLTQTVTKANTTTALASSANPSDIGQTVTFTATVQPVAPGSGTPTGTVTFRDGSTVLGTRSLNANRQAAFTTSLLALGSHTITATYNGDGNFNGSTSAALTQVVNPPCAEDVTARVRITQGSLFPAGGYLPGLFGLPGGLRQVVTIENISGAAIQGPVSLVLDNLSSATLVGSSGSTTCTSPAGSPFVDVNLGDNVLEAGEVATVVLEFRPASSFLSYTPRLLAGPRAR